MDGWTKEYLAEENRKRDARIEELAAIVLSNPCTGCRGVLERSGKTVFKCSACGLGHRIKRKYVPKKPVDPTDSRNWKAKCSECGGTMDYRGLRYVCRKCGEVLEV